MREQTRASCELHCSLHSWKALGYHRAASSRGIEVGTQLPTHIKLIFTLFSYQVHFCKKKKPEGMRFRGGDLQGERGWQNKVKRSAKYQVCCLMLIFALFQNFCIAVALWENFWLWLWKYCCYCFRSAFWEFSWSQTTLPAIFFISTDSLWESCWHKTVFYVSVILYKFKWKKTTGSSGNLYFWIFFILSWNAYSTLILLPLFYFHMDILWNQSQIKFLLKMMVWDKSWV